MARSFDLIPVIDLKAGQVVHARAGERDLYRPIETRLTRSSAPHDILEALLALGKFAHVYVADLDAITGTGSHDALLAQLAQQFAVKFWVDRGIGTAARAVGLSGGLKPVIGSESLSSLVDLAEIASVLGPDGYVLSLDYRGEMLVGPAGIDTLPETWPNRIIAMTLARVGSGAGPDFDRLERVAAIAGDRRLFAAGGVRGLADLTRLRQLGISGALVATALHDGSLAPSEIATLASISYG
jgi:phosphoribosylformimino-5-aminoimidazole carboxamide ribotide isomerase